MSTTADATTTQTAAVADTIDRMQERHRAAAADVPYAHVTTLRIGGEEVASTGAAVPVIDPATGEQWGSVPEATPAEVDAAVRAARAAFPAWAARTPGERADALRRMADAIERRALPLALTNTLENGSPIAETSGAAANAAAILHVFAGLSVFLEEPDIRPFPGGVNETLVARDPVGVCALIAPWNFPINLVVIKLAPALLAGCTVVIKPASPTPLSVRFLLDAADEAGIPPGVINLVTGSAATGDALVRHPDVDKVAFTGSTPVGRRIAAACGELLRPVTLELGGKSAAIVLPDADLDAMSAVLLRSCMRNTGQTCYISTRLIATPERYDQLVEMVTATVGAASVGDPLEPSTVFGPVATAAQQSGVRELIRAGVAEGARATIGGDIAPPFPIGSFVAPTVFADVRPEHAHRAGRDLRARHHDPARGRRRRRGRDRQQHPVRPRRDRVRSGRGCRAACRPARGHRLDRHQLLRLEPPCAVRRAARLGPRRRVRHRGAVGLPHRAVGAPPRPLSRVR